MDKKMNRKEFYDYIHDSFAVSGEFSRLLDNVLQFIEENCPSERQHDVLLSLLDGTIGLSDEEISKVHMTPRKKQKYELTNRTIDVNGKTLFRIRALIDFADVKAGSFGGYIERVCNLDQTGDSWVYDSAQVSGKARVRDNAKVRDNARVSGNAKVRDNAEVSDNAHVSGKAKVSGKAEVRDKAKVSGKAEVRDNAWVSGKAQVSGNARISDYAWISDNTHVSGKAKVSGRAQVSGNARVSDYAWVSDNAQVSGKAQVSGEAQVSGDTQVSGNARVSDYTLVSGNARVSGNAKLSGCANVRGNANVCDDADIYTSRHVFCAGPIGSRDDYITFFQTKDLNVGVRVGCFSGTITEFREKVAEVHGETVYGNTYNLLSDVAEQWIVLTGKGKEEKTQQSITVKTELGDLTAYPSTDPNHPGIYIDLKRDGECQGAPIAMTEFSCDEADLEEGAAHIITRIWDNCAKEDYSTRVVHKGIEEYFSADFKSPN